MLPPAWARAFPVPKKGIIAGSETSTCLAESEDTTWVPPDSRPIHPIGPRYQRAPQLGHASSKPTALVRATGFMQSLSFWMEIFFS